MNISTLFTLFISMIVLAAIPGPGVFVVVARTLSAGFKGGLMCSAGIVCGDYIFIVLALAGVSVLAESYYELFLALRYVGAGYLIYLGLSLVFVSRTSEKKDVYPSKSANFLSGLLTTLSNPKAILFYLSFFPAFVSPTALSLIDLLSIYAVATISVGGVMIIYVCLCYKGKSYAKNSKVAKGIKYTSGLTLVGSGVLVATRS